MKILCLPYTHTLSHLSRPLAVALELRERGHDVVFAGESTKIRFIEQEGFTVLPLHEPDPLELYGNIRAGKLQFVSEVELNRLIADDVSLFKAVQPDIVLSDGRFSAPISAHIAGVSQAAIVNVSSTAYRALPYIPFFDWLPTWLIQRETASWKMLDRLNLALEMLIFDNAMKTFSRLSSKHGLPVPVTATTCLTGKDLTLLADIPEYFPTRNLPGDYHYIGPLTWRQEIKTPSWWPPVKRGKPLIYVTMGTTGIGDFFDRAIESLKSSELSAVITTGGQKGDLTAIEGRIYVEDYLDGDLMMKECDLVVCHGGNGTIYQALQQGKPVLGIPTIPDQQYNMRRVCALDVGKMLSIDNFIRNPQSLLGVVDSIVNNARYYRNAERLQEMLSTYDAPVKAADLIENMQC
jgi:UDP:flavonoid glycosyltransferase YjiC (YdhE family)